MHLFGTLHINCRNQGASELYPLVATSYAQGLTDLATLATSRKSLLAPDCTLAGALLSDGDVRGDSYPLGAQITIPSPGTYTTTPPASTYAAPNVALRNLVSSGPLKRGTRWMHFIPFDQFSGSGGYTPITPWATNLGQFYTFLSTLTAIATRAPGSEPPAWTFSAVNAVMSNSVATRRLGRPFGLPRGRRLIR
jgi:hypothetical protein